MKKIIRLTALALLINSCSGDKPNNVTTPSPVAQISQLIAPTFNSLIRPEDSVLIKLNVSTPDKINSHVTFSINGEEIYKTKEKKKEYLFYWKPPSNEVGTFNIKTQLKANDNQEVRTTKVQVLSDIVPQKQSVRVVASYPHNTESYTQGLEFFESQLYEGTGTYGKSKLLQVDLFTGQNLQEKKLPNSYFGEGITIMDNKIYQITYKSGIGFVYDLNSLEKINEFSYNTEKTEGWGLTHNDSLLIMSDGSHQLYFIDPTTFREVRRQEVFSDQGAAMNINELEYINGEIFANVYTTNYVVRINPNNGKITGLIDLSNLFNELDSQYNIDYLNGIAYNKASKRLYVTGKYWPKLFEIVLVNQ